MIKGSGTLISKNDEDGRALPFLTTDQILEQLAKFGFIITYDVKSNLPGNIISYLSMLYDLGFDKITRVCVEDHVVDGVMYYRPTTIVMKTELGNDDLLTFECRVASQKFRDKLVANSIMNVSNEPGMTWDWLKYMANISDILDENIDPTDDFETQTDIETGHLTPYTGPVSDSDEDDEDVDTDAADDQLTGD